MNTGQGYKPFPNRRAALGKTLVMSPSTCTVVAQAAVKLTIVRSRASASTQIPDVSIVTLIWLALFDYQEVDLVGSTDEQQNELGAPTFQGGRSELCRTEQLGTVLPR